jgi:hypothetical protein
MIGAASTLALFRLVFALGCRFVGGKADIVQHRAKADRLTAWGSSPSKRKPADRAGEVSGGRAFHSRNAIQSFE